MSTFFVWHKNSLAPLYALIILLYKFIYLLAQIQELPIQIQSKQGCWFYFTISKLLFWEPVECSSSALYALIVLLEKLSTACWHSRQGFSSKFQTGK